MENIKTSGIYFNETDIRKIVDKYLSWTDIVDGQIFRADDVMSDNTPIGTAIMVGVDGITCEAGSKIVKLTLSSGIYELPVETVQENDEINIRFERTIPIPGTYGQIVNGELDILTDEEKEFKKFVEDSLGDRNDAYAEAFRKDNVRNIGGRGLILLEKMKSEIEKDDILEDHEVTPTQLIAVFIEKTESYLAACRNVEALTEKHDALLEEYRSTFDETSKYTKKLARDIEILNRKIDANKGVSVFCLNTINAAVMPVLEADVDC